MKKLVALSVLMLLAVALCLGACSGDKDPGDTNAVLRLTMATGGTSGTYYPYGGALKQAIENATDYIKVTVNASGASIDNIQLIGAGDAHLAIVQNDVMDYAYNGTGIWTTPPVTGFATLMTLYPEICQLVVAADSGINSVADLAGKRVSTGDIGSGVEANALQILEAYDLTVDDITQRNLSFAASADAMKDRTIDAFFVTAGIPNTAVMDLQASRDIKIINIDDSTIDALIAAYPFYSKVTLTEQDYSFITEPVNTVAIQATLICSTSLDDQAAYDIVKAIFDSKETIAIANAKGEYIDLNAATLSSSIDFHPGARKYFEEQGVL